MRSRPGIRFLLLALAALAVPMDGRGQTRPAAPGFDGAAAFRHVERLVGFGPRPAGSPALVRARDYLVGELKRSPVQVRMQRFEGRTPHGPIAMTNVIAIVPGRRHDVIMLGGHYDTKFFLNFPFVGANDGGSSAGLLLELARRVAATPREYTYWVVFFDGEEARASWSAADSIYGARHLAEELRKSGEIRKLRAVLVLDMIGDRNLNIRREAYSTPWLTDIVWASARQLGHGAYFLSDTLSVEDDHLPFVREGIPAALVIDLDYRPWHTAADTLAETSPRSLQVVGDVVLNALPTLEAALARGRPGGSK
jgi:hypothetical protein